MKNLVFICILWKTVNVTHCETNELGGAVADAFLGTGGLFKMMGRSNMNCRTTEEKICEKEEK